MPVCVHTQYVALGKPTPCMFLMFCFLFPFQQDSLYHLPNMSLEAFDLTQNETLDLIVK